jgi:tRNA A37 threonylcarbamoyladenosine dehydratase
LSALARRFGGIARLYGDAGLASLQAGHVVVVGIGGVGSWAAEALARSGVGRLTLVDLDHVAESNLNRQVHALGSTLGAAKVEVMAARIADISADCRVEVIDEFVSPENAATLLPAADWVIDAIDPPRAKAALIAHCRRAGRAIVVCGAAGGRTDPLRLARGDLSSTRGDALLSAVRARLRREHGFPREAGRSFDVPVVYSTEPAADGGAREGGGAALACAGYGSIVTVTAAMGLAAAQSVFSALATRDA